MADKYQQGVATARITLLANILLALVKGTAGILAHSSALTADALHTVSDCASTIVVAFGLRVSGKPADDDHPYGHGRAETIATKILALMLIAAGAWILVENVGTLFSGPGEPPQVLALWVVIISLVAKEAMYRYTIGVARKIGSTSLRADAWHHRSDALSSVAALIGIAGSRLGYPGLDPLAGLAVAAMIIYAGFQIARDSVRMLMDTQERGVINQARAHALLAEGVADVDAIRVRRYGNQIHIDLEISVPSSYSVKTGHAIAQNTREFLKEQMENVSDVFVHVNPKEQD